MCSSLPQETINQIIDCVAEDRDRQTLKSCSTVSHIWTHQAQKHLFSFITFNPALVTYPNRSLPRNSSEVLKISPHLGAFVKYLNVFPEYRRRGSTEHVHLQRFVYQALANLSALETVALNGAKDPTFGFFFQPGEGDVLNDVRHTLHQLPALRSVIFRYKRLPRDLIKNLGTIKRLVFLNASFINYDAGPSGGAEQDSQVPTRPESLYISSTLRPQTLQPEKTLGLSFVPPNIPSHLVDLSNLSTLSLHLKHFSRGDITAISSLLQNAQHMAHVRLWVSLMTFASNEDIVDLSTCAALVSVDLNTAIYGGTLPHRFSLKWLVGVLGSIKSHHLSCVIVYFTIEPSDFGEISNLEDEDELGEDEGYEPPDWSSLDLLLAKMQDELDTLKVVININWLARVPPPLHLDEEFGNMAFPALWERRRFEVRWDRKNGEPFTVVGLGKR